jgi:SNF2 family DNA or RNA helicase
LKTTDIYHKNLDKTSTTKLNPFIDKYGAKVGSLISFCRKITLNDTNRIIVFSQWDKLLQLIALTLSQNGVPNTIIKGNVYQRNKAIRSFKKGDTVQVILLSTEHSASGTNLTEANYIVFMDPIEGTSEYVNSIEQQAIARAMRIGQTNEIKILRLITANTIEEEIWQKYNNGKILKSSIDMA